MLGWLNRKFKACGLLGADIEKHCIPENFKPVVETIEQTGVGRPV